MSGALLLYTAIIAPVQIFLWEFNEEECNMFPSLYFDVFVDLFFIVSFCIPAIETKSLEFILEFDGLAIAWQMQIEVILNFFTGSLDMSETYCDDIRLIAARYIAAPGGFWFDFATSLPWSLNDLLAYQVTYTA